MAFGVAEACKRPSGEAGEASPYSQPKRLKRM